jgi:hypothetical protein
MMMVFVCGSTWNELHFFNADIVTGLIYGKQPHSTRGINVPYSETIKVNE